MLTCRPGEYIILKESVSVKIRTRARGKRERPGRDKHGEGRSRPPAAEARPRSNAEGTGKGSPAQVNGRSKPPAKKRDTDVHGSFRRGGEAFEGGIPLKIRLICARLAAAALAICLAFTSCGIIGEEGGASSGPGQDVGSYESGESDTSSGDASSGGATSGGTSSDGTSSGDATSGGTSSGGASSGGTSSGGTSSGGASSGGTTSGGTSSGGASSGGASSGGVSSDDASSGGTSSGFEPGADGNWEIIDRDSPITLSEYYWRSTLNTAERKIYDAVAYAASTVSETASFTLSPTNTDTLKKVIELFLLDHPEVFWWGNRYTYSTVGGKVTKVEFTFMYDREKILSMQDETEDAARDILSQLPADATDFEAALFFHDWLGENVVYKAPATVDDPTDYQSYTVYGALINGEGVCECYAEAFQFLCHMAGIPAIGITGTADNGSVTENHKWNGVKLGGEWYLVDATWDDAGEYGVRHSYFGMTGADMANHFVSEDLKEGLPAFDSDKASYYVYYGLMCDGSDPEEAVVRGLELAKEKDGDTFLLELRGTDADAAADCFALLKANGSRRLRAIIDTYNRLNGTDYSLDSYFSVSDMNTLCYIISK